MVKTPTTYKETLQGILGIHEIEKIVLDNLIKVQKFVFRDYTKLTIDEQTAKRLHRLLAANLFEEAGEYRTHDVQLGSFEPPPYYKIAEHMKNWEGDYRERAKHARSESEKIAVCAWLIHRFLWIHPFFGYNGRTSRLLGELYLLKNRLPVVSFRATPRIDFVKAVKEATQTGNLSLLEQLMRKRSSQNNK